MYETFKLVLISSEDNDKKTLHGYHKNINIIQQRDQK